MNKYKKVLIFMLIVALGLFLNTKFQLSSLIDSKNLKEVSDFVDNNYVYSIALYLVFTIIGSSVLALPGVTFAVIASGLFGPWIGSLYCLIGATLGAVLSFLLSRYLLKDSIEELVKKNDKLYNIIFQTDSEKELLILMITRLLPIFPFNLQNFAYGITNISIVKYTIGTFLFMIPGVVIFSIGTEGVINAEDRSKMFLMALLIIFLMMVLGTYLYKKYKLLTIKEQDEE
ncbi:TVP38/TMEM64 family protein [Tissierella pigra]|uniref:TVP38/TMEM64 family membrane protein n=1 Tax=Tissierella pigra TaxID=2607614 RepID=A0A6N7XZH4_9FIRM|nr:TVP38/TMEM64 family protein [Tissierella pigra]MBU5428304.1 TVP38/TMEM64 family protein [Tissierella pigra]MSU01628.1 TVP38/TMEM64 family protein [Tissierella pigra]